MPRVTVNVLLLLVAIVAGVIAALGGFGWWDWAERYAVGFVGLSLASGWASFVAWGTRPAV